MTDTATPVLCGNDTDDHAEATPKAVARVTFPCGRWKPAEACESCLETVIWQAVAEDVDFSLEFLGGAS